MKRSARPLRSAPTASCRRCVDQESSLPSRVSMSTRSLPRVDSLFIEISPLRETTESCRPFQSVVRRPRLLVAHGDLQQVHGEMTPAQHFGSAK